MGGILEVEHKLHGGEFDGRREHKDDDNNSEQEPPPGSNRKQTQMDSESAKFNPACAGRKRNIVGAGDLSAVMPTGHQQKDKISNEDKEGLAGWCNAATPATPVTPGTIAGV